MRYHLDSVIDKDKDSLMIYIALNLFLLGSADLD